MLYAVVIKTTKTSGIYTQRFVELEKTLPKIKQNMNIKQRTKLLCINIFKCIFLYIFII